MDIGKHMRAYSWCGIGRRKSNRAKILKAFIAEDGNSRSWKG
jgi:hypothetical protein